MITGMSRTIRQRKMRQRRAARRRAQVTFLLFVLFLASMVGAAYAGYNYLKGDDKAWPSIHNLAPQRIGQNSVVYARDGEKMGYIKSDQNRRILRYDEMGEW